MRISQRGIQLIKESECLHLQAYRCPAGVWTIGYGHTKTTHQGMIITPPQAEQLFDMDCKDVELVLNTSALRLNQNQFDSFADFIFNFGGPKFRSATFVKIARVNPDDQRIAFELRRWNKATNPQGILIVLPGLVTRRQKEIALYFTP